MVEDTKLFMIVFFKPLYISEIPHILKVMEPAVQQLYSEKLPQFAQGDMHKNE